MLRSLRGFLMISLFIADLSGHSVNEFSKSRNLKFSPGVISLSRSRTVSKIALSRTFCPVPSEFEIAGLDCTYTTQQFNVFQIHITISNRYGFNLFYKANLTWNLLPENLKSSPSWTVFKNNIKWECGNALTALVLY